MPKSTHKLPTTSLQPVVTYNTLKVQMNSLAALSCRVLSVNSVPYVSLLLAPCMKRSQCRNTDCCCGGRHGNVRFSVIKERRCIRSACGQREGKESSPCSHKARGSDGKADSTSCGSGGWKELQSISLQRSERERVSSLITLNAT